MTCVADIRKVNRDLVGLLIECCIQAYNAFAKNNPSHCTRERVTAPEGFELLDCWSGVDSLFGRDRSIETYGLLFRSVGPPWRYIFAFRGTDSTLDMLDDCGVEPQAFCAHDPAVLIPKEVRVESGFNDIYKNGVGTVAPMQSQLFTLIDKYRDSEKPIDEICITGHSLGAALSQLFTLDLALSRPGLPTINVNFASPRVGNKAFVRFFEESSPGSTLRVQNTHDMVPHLPPTELGFEHISSVYLIAFHKVDVLGKFDLLANHSSLNYKAIIDCATANAGRHCPAGQAISPAGQKVIRCELPNPDHARQSSHLGVTTNDCRARKLG